MAKITKDQLKKLQKKLKTDQAIAGEFGISRQAVYQLRKKYGIESSRADNDERDKEIKGSYDAGAYVDELAKKYKLSLSHTYRIITGGKSKTAAKKKIRF